MLTKEVRRTCIAAQNEALTKLVILVTSKTTELSIKLSPVLWMKCQIQPCDLDRTSNSNRKVELNFCFKFSGNENAPYCWLQMGEFPSSTRKRKLLLLPTNETKFEFKKIREEHILNKYFRLEASGNRENTKENL